MGSERESVVDRLDAGWAQVLETGEAQLIALVGEPGYGKTRIVQELYARIAGRQQEPAYWPSQIYDLTGPIDANFSESRKAVRPRNFIAPLGVSPEMLWIGAALGEGEGFRADPGLDDIIRQIETHLARVLLARERRERTVRLARKMAGLIGIPDLLEFAIDARDLSRELGGLFRRAPDGTTISDHAGHEERLAAFHRTVRQIWGEDGRDGPPTVLVIEDVHTAQRPTVELLQSIVTSDRLPFLCIACGQRQVIDTGAPISTLLAAGLSRVERIDVPQLSTEAISEVAWEMMPRTSPDVLRAVTEKWTATPSIFTSWS